MRRFCAFGLAFAALPAFAADPGAGLNGAGLSALWVVPVAGILLSIALMPVTAPAFWHHHFGKTTAFWALQDFAWKTGCSATSTGAPGVARASTTKKS